MKEKQDLLKTGLKEYLQAQARKNAGTFQHENGNAQVKIVWRESNYIVFENIPNLKKNSNKRLKPKVAFQKMQEILKYLDKEAQVIRKMNGQRFVPFQLLISNQI